MLCCHGALESNPCSYSEEPDAPATATTLVNTTGEELGTAEWVVSKTQVSFISGMATKVTPADSK